MLLLVVAAFAGTLHLWTLHNAMGAPDTGEPDPNPDITYNGNDMNDIEYKHYAWPGNRSGNKPVPDDEADSEIEVIFLPWDCYDYTDDEVEVESAWINWDGGGLYFKYTYQPTNPISAYSGTFKSELECEDGGAANGGGNGGEGGEDDSPEFTLDVKGQATQTLVIHQQSVPFAYGPFILCVEDELTVESALQTNSGTTTVFSEWSVNGNAALNNSKTFDIPEDFPYDFLDAYGNANPAQYDLDAAYECPVTQETLTANAEVVVLKVELKSIEFTSDHEDGGGDNLLQNYNADYAGTAAAYAEPEWVDGGDNNPISHTKDTKITAKVKIKVEPAGITFDLKGDGPNGYVDFNKAEITSTGADQEITVTADAKLPNEVDTMTKSIDWTIDVSGTEWDAGTSGGHKIYVTYGTPTGGGYTENRIRWVCTKADSAVTDKDCSDKIHDALGNVDPPHERGEKVMIATRWVLLDANTWGECDEQAELMESAVKMSGVPATMYQTYASTDATVTPESKFQDGKLWWLFFDFTGDGTIDNRFEGCVETAGHCYAVLPKLDAASKCALLRQIGPDNYGAKQMWARTDDDTINGSPVETLPGFEGYPACP